MATVDVCAVGDIAPGEHVVVDAGSGVEVAVYFVDDTYYAIDDLCTHDYGPLADGEVEGFEVICPRHGARFDMRTGEATCPPAHRSVDTYVVSVVDGRIVVTV